jgi:hypothetical protein
MRRWPSRWAGLGADVHVKAPLHEICELLPHGRRPPPPRPQVVDKSRYAAGDNSLEREIQVLLKVRARRAADLAHLCEAARIARGT